MKIIYKNYLTKEEKKIKIQLQNNGKDTGYFELKAQENKAELIIYGEISSDKWDGTEVTPIEIKELLDTVQGKELDIYINSAGGNVFAGMAIYHMLKRHEGKKNVYIDGIGASIASIIAMAGDEIYIPRNAYLMIHCSWLSTVGNKKELKQACEILEKLDESMADIYKTKAKEEISKEDILKIMDEETWMNGLEAKEYFNITTIEENEGIACIDGISPNASIPSRLKRITAKQRIENEKQRQEAMKKLKSKLEF